jgi:hypothetical protein
MASRQCLPLPLFYILHLVTIYPPLLSPYLLYKLSSGLYNLRRSHYTIHCLSHTYPITFHTF